MRESVSTPGSDFLERMAEKAFDRDGGIQPRIPSLFEPSPANGMSAAMGLMGWQAETNPSVNEELPLSSQRSESHATSRQPQETRAQTVPARDETEAIRIMPPVEPMRSMTAKPDEGASQWPAPPPIRAAVTEAGASHRANVDAATERLPGDKQAATSELEASAPERRPALIPAMVSPVQVPSRSAAPQPDRGVLSWPRSKIPAETYAGAFHDPQMDNGIPGARRTGTLIAPPMTTASVFPAREDKFDRVQPAHETQNAISEPAGRFDKQDQGTASLVPVPQRIVIEPATVVHRPIRAESRVEIPERALAPVVNVTIGRIEVRAMQAPPTPTRQQGETRGPRPMSLDEYLKQRAGER